jgi:hypothetical protein
LFVTFIFGIKRERTLAGHSKNHFAEWDYTKILFSPQQPWNQSTCRITCSGRFARNHVSGREGGSRLREEGDACDNDERARPRRKSVRPDFGITGELRVRGKKKMLNPSTA